MGISTLADNIETLIAVAGATITVFVAWADMRARVKEHDKRLSQHDEEIGELKGLTADLRDQHVKALADVKVMFADLKADIKVVKAAVADKKEHPR